MEEVCINLRKLGIVVGVSAALAPCHSRHRQPAVTLVKKDRRQ